MRFVIDEVLPKGYKKLKYLEGTGTQFIETGLDYFADFEIDIQLRQNAANKAIGNGQGWCMQRKSVSDPFWQFTSTNNHTDSTVSILERHVMKWKNDEVYADGVKLFNKVKTLNNGNPMRLFTSQTNQNYPNVIYACKLWNPTTGALVRNYIPALRISDDKPGLYDNVNGEFYVNGGTGEFLYEVIEFTETPLLINNPKYKQVEYLEST